MSHNIVVRPAITDYKGNGFFKTEHGFVKAMKGILYVLSPKGAGRFGIYQ